ncbi:hypothetical protein V6N11_036830 [Hibiscus sabdariffa]|uniref:Uncharacterized protein n=1 Tax=Hibiscus sabdariffa TaxID=183260 RepID=A0ABR2RBM2_9ROSI
MFTPFFRKLRKGLWVSASSRGPVLNRVEFDGELEVATPAVPDYIKEGYFTVFAVKRKETQRYVIELDNLTNPEFLSLLELAREEYRFQQKGVLCLPYISLDLYNHKYEETQLHDDKFGSYQPCLAAAEIDKNSENNHRNFFRVHPMYGKRNEAKRDGTTA